MQKQSKSLAVVVTEQHGPTLLGRNCLGELKLLMQLLLLQHINYDPELEQLLFEYKEVFAEGLGELKILL